MTTPEPLRTCIHCGLEAYTEAELEAFTKDPSSKYGYKNSCRACTSKYVRKWQKQNPAKFYEYQHRDTLIDPSIRKTLEKLRKITHLVAATIPAEEHT